MNGNRSSERFSGTKVKLFGCVVCTSSVFGVVEGVMDQDDRHVDDVELSPGWIGSTLLRI
jgi:hypothetical protein